MTVENLKTEAGSEENGPRFIVVEGPIGVGKTSLAKRLADSFGGELILEHVEENPFLERFYKSGRSAALPAQLFFLFQRARQLEELRQSDLFSPVRIADFLLEKDRLFAEVNLDREELSLYQQISEKMEVESPAPDLVIYLQASVDALLQRIARRGISYERNIDRNYLEQVTEAYARFFHSYDSGPLLIVNASSIDPVHNDADYQQLYQQIRRTTGGRHFFNPAAAMALA
ncbi:MAG: deoxynucleoside kinase [Gammaproteobacteria bacterium]|nr:deoxynucleoside kinase [Gammaproteobacteria bacterium]